MQPPGCVTKGHERELLGGSGSGGLRHIASCWQKQRQERGDTRDIIKSLIPNPKREPNLACQELPQNMPAANTRVKLG